MKTRIYIIACAAIMIASACSGATNLARATEDDIYYVPGKHSLYVQELEQQTGQSITPNTPNNAAVYNGRNENRDAANTASRAIGMARYATTRQVEEAEARNPGSVDIIPIPEDDGYWMSGFTGSDRDLEECVRIMNLYPEGFALFGNGYEIALNLSFSPDWNVYTLGNRYWWFPTPSNIELYTKFIFGTYPGYAMTIAWNNPRLDAYAFDHFYNSRFWFGGSRWGWGWNWRYGGGYYDPWYYSSWYYNPWYDHYYDWRFYHHHYGYHYGYYHDRYYSHYHDRYHRNYYAGRRPDYVSRSSGIGRGNPAYYNNRTNYTGRSYTNSANRASSRSNPVNDQRANARSNYNRTTTSSSSTYNRNAPANQGSSRSTINSSTYQRTPPAQGASNTSTNARVTYTRNSATATTPSNTTNRSTNTSTSSSSNASTSTYRQGSSSPSNTSSTSRSNTSSSSSTSRSSTSSSSTGSSSYSRSSSSSSSSGSSSSSSRSSSSSSSRSSSGRR